MLYILLINNDLSDAYFPMLLYELYAKEDR